MRMRDRHWTNTEARRVLPSKSEMPPEKCDEDYCNNIADEQFLRQQLENRGEQLRSSSSRRYTDIQFNKIDTYDGRKVDSPARKRNIGNVKNVRVSNAFIKTLTNARRTPGTPSLRRPPLSLAQDLVNGISSQLSCRTLGFQSSLPSHPRFVMTRNGSTLSSRPEHRKAWIHNSITSSAVSFNFSDDVNNCSTHRNGNDSGTNTKIARKKSAVKNSYRHIDETLFDLSSDRIVRDVSIGVTFATADGDDDRKASVDGASALVAGNYSRMNISDLPPLASSRSTPREDKQKIPSNRVNSTGIKSSVSQSATSVSQPATSVSQQALSIGQPATSSSTKTNYSRRSSTATVDSCKDNTVLLADERMRKRFSVNRNLSDSSLSNLQGSISNHSKESGSTLSGCSTTQIKPAGGRSNQGREETRNNGASKEVKTFSNGQRTMSWSVKDVSECEDKLDILLENQNSKVAGHTNRTSKFNLNDSNNNITSNNLNRKLKLTYPVNQYETIVKKAANKTVENVNLYNKRITSNNNNNTNEMPAPSSTTKFMRVDSIKNAEDVFKRFKSTSKKLLDEDFDESEIDLFVSKGKMVRSKSENKLNGQPPYYSNANNARVTNPRQNATPRSISKDFSADKSERLKSNDQQSRGVTTPSRLHQNNTFNIRKSTSVSNLYNRDVSNSASNRAEEHHAEHSIESIRLVEWLNVVNNIDKYDTDPKNDVVEYSEEPPQTDTAIHLVYEGE